MPLRPDSTRAPMYAGIATDDEVPGAFQPLDDDWTAANAAGYTHTHTQYTLTQYSTQAMSQPTTLGPFWRHK